MKRIKVGITVSGGQTDAQSLLWSNGIAQNVIYLALLLQRLPNVELATLVTCPEGATHPLGEAYGIPVMPLTPASETLDVIIEVGARANAEPVARLRERGGKIVSYMAGNALILSFEEMSCDLRHGDHVTAEGFDSVWITPQHWHTNHSYAKVTRSASVEMVPHIWHPICLMQSAFLAGNRPYWQSRPVEGWRLGVFDPNVNVVKTFHFPLLVAEECFRRDPALIDRILLFNAQHLIPNVHFEEFCNVTDLGRAKKIFAEGRFAVGQVLGVHIDAVVTHQWENNLNYLYWDILYLGWPLIHNSIAFPEAGYYYPEFDTKTGGEVLQHALRTHEAEWQARRPAVLDTLWRFNIDNPVVQQQHVELLEKLMD